MCFFRRANKRFTKSYGAVFSPVLEYTVKYSPSQEWTNELMFYVYFKSRLYLVDYLTNKTLYRDEKKGKIINAFDKQTLLSFRQWIGDDRKLENYVNTRALRYEDMFMHYPNSQFALSACKDCLFWFLVNQAIIEPNGFLSAEPCDEHYIVHKVEGNLTREQLIAIDKFELSFDDYFLSRISETVSALSKVRENNL